MDDRRRRARELAKDYLARGDSLGWFEHLYIESAGEIGKIPWADSEPNPNLVEWIEQHELNRGSALVVGCGLGDDAEYLASLEFQVRAFDISKTAITWCQRRFPDSKVAYEAYDLFRAPDHWKHGFNFVFEAYTLQSLPVDLRQKAMRHIADWLSPCGSLLVVCRARDSREPLSEAPPWPLAREELEAFDQSGLRILHFEDFFDAEKPPVRRFRASYQRVDPARG